MGTAVDTHYIVPEVWPRDVGQQERWPCCSFQ
jgi:hypothetical protein